MVRVTGMAYSGGTRASATDPTRVTIALAFAFLIHFIPMTYLIMPASMPPPPEVESVSIDLSDVASLMNPSSPLTPEQNQAQNAVELPKLSAPEMTTMAALKPPAAQPPAAPAPKPVAPPTQAPQAKPPETPKAPELKLPTLPDMTVKPDVKTSKMALSPMKTENVAAFDESKSTEKAPENAHASDRNSTAADNGPKDLPRGEPFMKDGKSNFVFDREKRGEGNLPDVVSAPEAGSIKIEGSPDAGKGLDADATDKKRPVTAALPVDKGGTMTRPIPAPPQAPTARKNEEVAAPTVAPETALPSKPKLAGFEADPNDPTGSMPVGEKIVKGPEKSATAPKQKANAIPPPPSIIDAPDDAMQTAAKSTSKSDELADFAASLATIPNSSGRGGSVGDKPGIQARPGQKGHEGNGTLRPGNENATSDVVTFNITTSAQEVDQPRFAKRLDPVAAYFKAIKRRTDAKWKAMVYARLRSRADSGLVTIHVVMHKSGKLLEASVETRTDGLPDEYAAMAKEAVEQACNPIADPFSGELAKSDKCECYFTFLY